MGAQDNSSARRETPALAETSLEVKDGEFITIVGPSGCGKITGASLKGMRVGVFDDAWTKAMLGVVLKTAGLTTKDIQQVTATDSDIPLLIANKIDVATNTSNFAAPQYARETGKQRETLLATAAGAPDIPIWNYAGNKRWLQKNLSWPASGWPPPRKPPTGRSRTRRPPSRNWPDGSTHLYLDIGTPGTIVPFGEWSRAGELGAESAGI